MLRLLTNLGIAVMLIAGGFLAAYSPDSISLVFAAVMLAILLLGVVVGLFPTLSFASGFRRGVRSIRSAEEVQSDSVWSAFSRMENIFHQRTLNRLFDGYRDKLRTQQESGQILSDVEDYINEDVLAVRSWQGVIGQIPGTLTGLGILGTFTGLILGLQNVGFGSVNAALISVQTLLAGIETAFYTSISGVILSILFNIIHKVSWNMMLRELDFFTEEFHKQVIPTVEEQARYRERKESRRVIELLNRLPKNPGYSAASSATGSAATAMVSHNEQILMPQILEGLKNGEFVFLLQPRYDLNTRKMVGAEALVRWNHPTLGMLSPGTFIPVLENNGYITKLDQYIWEAVCARIRIWMDQRMRILPISVNVTRMDVLALDVPDFFSSMRTKYRIPPRYLEIEIAENAYLMTHSVCLEIESRLMDEGFQVAVDGFAGDFISLNAVGHIGADCLKLDLRYLESENSRSSIGVVLEQAKKLGLNIVAEGIENMEQLNLLRKNGCTQGQGYYFSKPLSVEEYEKLMQQESRGEA
ncbi:EAL domain-containing protein [Lachnoclostridium sp. Marseille-P6806]|uniref:EAL domain-containing protein n=1 Tax=Lachnoclostridium sp. Marseille-P6806 TaxID=2364793 RepID=UPI0013EF1668|nr:EAL domain-containing protein [Lachnoclostridium sp. Marseille-P6806]